MLKRFSLLLGVVRQIRGASSRRKKEVDHGASVYISHLCFKPDDSSVKIIHAGGLVELYKSSIPASHLMDKYPGMCLARPQVFKRPHESVLHPEDKLLPGQKFYLIPCSTVRKLKLKYPQRLHKEAEVVGRGFEDEWDSAKLVDGGADFSDIESVCSAKDFFASRENWSNFLLRKCGRGLKKKPFAFTPPIKRSKTWHRMEWEPSLTSVQELSP